MGPTSNSLSELLGRQDGPQGATVGPTPRNRLLGLLADALGAGNEYAQQTRQVDPASAEYASRRWRGEPTTVKANPMLSSLAELLGVGDVAATADRASYGLPLTQGQGMARQMLPETKGALLSMGVPSAKWPKQAAGLAGLLGGFADNGAAGKTAMLAAKPLVNDAARQAANYERGWYRGGPQPTDNRMTGPWYTRNEGEAEDYARRFGSGADVREYAIPSGMMLKMDRPYDARLATDLAAKAEETLGPDGAKLARLIRSSYKEGERPSGMELWRASSKTVGDDAAAGLFGSLGFRSAIGINSPDYLRMFPGGTVRDAQRATFDPSKLHLDNIMAGAGGLGLLGAASRSRDNE